MAKNKPDAFMPFYGNDFFQAVKGLPDSVALGYLKAIWYYWNHEHCKGLRDDREFLRKVCEIDREEWDSACQIIFDNEKMFTLGADGKWHQTRAEEEWAKAQDRLSAAINAANTRWGKRGKP
jgi:uncharacterized protein YdaU (DUF1376 family)